MPHRLDFYYDDNKTDYVNRALQIIDRLRDENKITIREKGCLRRAILENRKTEKLKTARGTDN